ncbi:hypothetical protein JI742_06500 [Piscinibacter sp. Jin2]|uniref:Uncharacterized protein n=1 Tax=Aquariibacter lacus TaxID=2801332 RepID=A0A9X1BQC0_9BURK|nr:hypothetical protein [Piscinibacter lacus]MBL0719536.1 hypothetical protein [Piscinibacter lacus]
MNAPVKVARCAVYFVASPLQLLAARQIAATHEAGSRQVLVWYKPGLAKLVRSDEWDACHYLAWPRWEPLPGPFGGLRRLRRNLREVAGVVGPCNTVVLHSAVFDTEAINYFLHDLPRRCGASQRLARILPDGLISIRRYPLSLAKRVAQWLRKLRRLVAPELNYTPFAGDRIGSDAAFCDRIYVLAGLPHAYPQTRTCVLRPLAERGVVHTPPSSADAAGGVGLVIGQPLAGSGLMAAADVQRTQNNIHAWLKSQGCVRILYKPHPKDANHELRHPDYELVEPIEPLETWLASARFDYVAGVRSSGLIFARQVQPTPTRVAAFGWSRIRFKNTTEYEEMSALFTSLGIEQIQET